MVVKAAQLLELFGAGFARQDLIHSFSDFVARIGNCVVFELPHLKPVEHRFLFDRQSHEVPRLEGEIKQVLNRLSFG